MHKNNAFKVLEDGAPESIEPKVKKKGGPYLRKNKDIYDPVKHCANHSDLKKMFTQASGLLSDSEKLQFLRELAMSGLPLVTLKLFVVGLTRPVVSGN